MIVWLSSYPRSGNTLVRTLLHQCFGLVTYSKYNDDTDIGADPKIAAQVGHQRFEGDWPDVYVRFRRAKDLHIVKTHDAPEDQAAAIVVVRHGWTSTVSNQHYLKDFSGIDASLNDVITGRAGQFPSWGRFLDLWDPENRPETLLLKYEDLLADPAKDIKRLAAFLKRRAQGNWQNNFKEMQRLDRRFFRQGRAKITRNEFGATHAALFEQIHGDWMARLGYTPAPAPADPDGRRGLREEIAAGDQRRDARAEEAQRHIDNLKAQVDQLAATSLQQDAYIATLKKERDRSVAGGKAAKIEVERTAQVGQKQIDLLKAQLDRLAATSREQDAYIVALKKERDRFAAAAQAGKAELERSAPEAQQQIDALKAQLDRLADTSREQDAYIVVLKKEIDRLQRSGAKSSADCAHYLKVINEQTAYIGLLEQQRGPRNRDAGNA